MAVEFNVAFTEAVKPLVPLTVPIANPEFSVNDTVLVFVAKVVIAFAVESVKV